MVTCLPCWLFVCQLQPLWEVGFARRQTCACCVLWKTASPASRPGGAQLAIHLMLPCAGRTDGASCHPAAAQLPSPRSSPCGLCYIHLARRLQVQHHVMARLQAVQQSAVRLEEAKPVVWPSCPSWGLRAFSCPSCAVRLCDAPCHAFGLSFSFSSC